MTAHWFAWRDPEAEPPFVWRPALNVNDTDGFANGLLTCQWLAFDSKEGCVDWMRENVVRAELRNMEGCCDQCSQRPCYMEWASEHYGNRSCPGGAQ